MSKSVKQYPNMTPVFSEIWDRESHRKLILAVVDAAKTWNDTPSDYISTHYTDDLDKAASVLGDAIDALEKFENEQRKEGNQ